MAKGVKNIVKEMNKKPHREKTFSDEMYNYRRRLRSKLSKEIERTSGVKLSSKASIDTEAAKYKLNKEAKSILKEITESFAKPISKGGGYSEKAISQLKRSDSYARSIERQNKAFQHQMNQATKRGGVSMLSGGKVKGFYAVNTDIFTGTGDSRLFNKRIMDKYGVNKLEDVFNLLTDEQLDYKKFGFSSQEEFDAWYEELDKRINITARREALQAELESLENRYKVGGTTEDDTYNGKDEQEKTTSPPEVNRIISRVATAMNNA